MTYAGQYPASFSSYETSSQGGKVHPVPTAFQIPTRTTATMSKAVAAENLQMCSMVAQHLLSSAPQLSAMQPHSFCEICKQGGYSVLFFWTQAFSYFNTFLIVSVVGHYRFVEF